MKVCLECNVDYGVWGTKEELSVMTDAELIDLFREDIGALVDEMTWIITREDTEQLQEEQ